MARVVHFEIPADDPERAINFYSNVLDWQIQKWEGPTDYWLATTGPEGTPGINGAIVARNGYRNVVNTVAVTSLDETARRVEANGGTIALPKTTVPGVGFLMYFVDTEGNLFGAIEAQEGVG